MTEYKEGDKIWVAAIVAHPAGLGAYVRLDCGAGDGWMQVSAMRPRIPLILPDGAACAEPETAKLRAAVEEALGYLLGCDSVNARVVLCAALAATPPEPEQTRAATLANRIVRDVLPSTDPETATFDQLAEEVLELHLALRGKHSDTPSMELIEVAGIALNALSLRPADEIEGAFTEWQERHGHTALAATEPEAAPVYAPGDSVWAPMRVFKIIDGQHVELYQDSASPNAWNLIREIRPRDFDAKPEPAGTPISRGEALRIARETQARAEAERAAPVEGPVRVGDTVTIQGTIKSLGWYCNETEGATIQVNGDRTKRWYGFPLAAFTIVSRAAPKPAHVCGGCRWFCEAMPKACRLGGLVKRATTMACLDGFEPWPG